MSEKIEFIDLKAQYASLKEIINHRIRTVLYHGQDRRYHHTRIGVGGRIERRIEAGHYYQALLRSLKGMTLPVTLPDRTCVWGQFTVCVKNRDALCDQLKRENVPTAIHYPVPLHQQPAYEKISRVSGSLDNANTAAALVMSLPMHPYLEKKTQNTIVNVLNRITA